MVLTLDIISLLLLFVIIIQDFRQRKISWIPLPLLFIAFTTKAILSEGFTEAILLFLKNFGFIFIQFLALVTFYFLKERKFTNIVNRQIGLGDVLFFIVICSAFSLLNFLFFYLSGLLLTIIGYLFYRIFSKKAGAEVPLAGCLSFILMLFIFLQYLNFHFNPYDDEQIIAFITQWRQ